MKVVHTKKTKKDQPINLLFYGDFNCTTGFGNVSKKLIDNWSKNKNFNITILAINDLTEKPYNYKENVMIIPCLAVDEKKDGYARLELLRILYSHDFDVFFALNDIEVLNSMTEHLANVKKERMKANKKKTKYILYTPIDSEPRPSDCVVLDLFDEIITYTEYAKAVLKPIVKESIWKKIKVIPHGIDTKVFYPIDNSFENNRTKEQIFRKSDVFVFGSVNRNSARKDLGTLMIGFAMFKHTSQANAVLYLHCNPQDRMGIDCYRLSERLGLEVGKDIFFPKDFNENNGISESELNKIYNTFDCFITTTTAEGWGLCLDPFTKIPTINGVKNIKDVLVGDMVLGNSGNYHKVLDTTCRNVEEILKVKTEYGYEVSTTIEHPYFVYSDLKNEGEFKRIKDIKKGDYLGIVKPKGDKPLLDKIDVLDYIDSEDINIIVEDKYLSNKFAYSPKNKKWSISEISKKYNVSKSISESAKQHLNYGISKKSKEVINLCEKLKKDGYVKPNSIKINRILEINDDFLYLIGWYLAEGSCENGIRVEFSLNIDELDIALRLKKIIESSFGISDTMIRKMKTKCALRISNKQVAQFFKNTCGQGALNKKIPYFLIGSEKKLMPLVKGYIEGDGHIRLERNHLSFTTISPSLAYQMQSVLVSNDILVYCKKTKSRGVGKHDSYKCGIVTNHLKKYMDLVGYDLYLKRDFCRKHKPYFIENESHFFIKIKEMSIVKEKTNVYDLCVEDTHSFVGNGLVCHNTVVEAMACKKLVVAPRHTSIQEITDNGNNAFLFKFMQRAVFVNDFEKIRFISNPDEVAQVCGIVYNLQNENDEVLADVDAIVQRAYNHVTKWKWKDIAKKFEDIILKLI